MTLPTVSALPLIGAALRTYELPHYIDWLAADQRDLEIQDPVYPAAFEMDWRGAARQCRDLLDSHGYKGRVGIHAVFSGVDISTWDTKIQQVYADRLKQCLEFGAIFGATHAVIHSPFQWFGTPLVYYSQENIRNLMISLVHMLIDPLMPTLKAMNCAFVIETIMDSNPRPLIDLVKSFESPHVRLSIDTGHVRIMERIGGGAPPDQWLMEGGDILEHIHLQDTDGHGDRHWRIGDGDIRWRAFFNTLQMTGAAPRMILELAQTSDILPSWEWLKAQGLAR